MHYPFAALVGQDALKTVLLLNAVYPAIGGVLIRGEKGTAKSTAARALAALLPQVQTVTDCPFNCDPGGVWAECPNCTSSRPAIGAPKWADAPFVDLPIGATEDRVLGTLDFEQALREGKRSFHPGLLASAHRGVLYIDEVNLLPDHLVDVLLDAAALGVNTVQREGVAVSHPARFILIGTMNPEEGDLRPQLLDRFGLMVEVTGPRDPELRAEVVRRRLDFEADPAVFAARWSAEQDSLRERITSARVRLPQVTLDDCVLKMITQLCCELDVDGLRADIILHKTARALAALAGRLAATVEDVRTAAMWVLPHRQRRRPFDKPKPNTDSTRLDQLLGGDSPSKPDGQSSTDDASAPPARMEGEEQVFAPAAPQTVQHIQVEPMVPGSVRGKRNPAPQRERGHYVRAVADGATKDVAIDATIRAAAARGARTDNGGVQVAVCDLRRKERAGRTGTLIVFVVDVSGSMAARRRMEAVKGAVLDLLRDAYQQRDEVAVIAFRGPTAQALLAPTRSVEQAEQALRVLPTGGRTPLAHALVIARDMLQRARSDLPALLVIISDGKANVSLPDSPGDPWQQVLTTAAHLASLRVPSLVLDTDAGFIRMGKAAELARALGGEHLPLENLSTETLVMKVRQAAKERAP